MNPRQLIPIPDSIPVSWGWIWFFLILTFVLHLLLMNTMLGSSIIGFFATFQKKRKLGLASDISKKLPFLIAFTINLGVAPFLFLQVVYGQFIYVSSILMAGFWLSIVALLIIAYYSAYVFDFSFEPDNKWGRLFIGLSAMILLIIGFLFSNNMTMMTSPEQWAEYFQNKKGILPALSNLSLYPRYLHIVAASIANTGLFLALAWRRKAEKGDLDANQSVNHCLKWYIHGTWINLAIGIWFLFTLPVEVQKLFLGKSFHSTCLMIIGTGSVLVSLYFAHKQKLRLCLAATLVSVIDMVMMRDAVRTAFLSPYFKISHLPVTGQYSPMVFFLVVLFIGIGVILYMLSLAVKSGKEGRT